MEHFVERFADVRLHAGIPGLGLLRDTLHEGVGHPLRARRRIPDVDALVPAVASPQVVQDPEVVVFVQIVRLRQAARGETAKVVIGQVGQKLLVLAGPGDQKALRHEPCREGDTDAGVVVRVERLARVGRVGVRGAAVAVHVDHAGDPGAQQPRRAQQGREPRREMPSQRERDYPGLQQPVPDSLLDCRDAVAVMMGVDHAGHDRDAIGAEDRRVRVPAAQGFPVADLGDRAVLDPNRRIAQNRIVLPAAGDDPPASNQHRIAHHPQPPARPCASEFELPACAAKAISRFAYGSTWTLGVRGVRKTVFDEARVPKHRTRRPVRPCRHSREGGNPRIWATGILRCTLHLINVKWSWCAARNRSMPAADGLAYADGRIAAGRVQPNPGDASVNLSRGISIRPLESIRSTMRSHPFDARVA